MDHLVNFVSVCGLPRPLRGKFSIYPKKFTFFSQLHRKIFLNSPITRKFIAYTIIGPIWLLSSDWNVKIYKNLKHCMPSLKSRLMLGLARRPPGRWLRTNGENHWPMTHQSSVVYSGAILMVNCTPAGMSWILFVPWWCGEGREQRGMNDTLAGSLEEPSSLPKAPVRLASPSLH